MGPGGQTRDFFDQAEEQDFEQCTCLARAADQNDAQAVVLEHLQKVPVRLLHGHHDAAGGALLLA